MKPKGQSKSTGTGISKAVNVTKDAAKVATNDQRGKRGSNEYAQLCVQIPKELKKDFRQAVIEYETNNSDVIEELVIAWLEGKRKS